MNYKGEIIDTLIDGNNPSIFYDFQVQISETHKREIDPVVEQKYDTESIISSKTSKNKVPTLIVIIVALLVCIGFGYAYLNSSPKVVNDNKLEKVEFLELSDEDKIKHYLKFEDLRDTNYIKTLYDLNNLHYWQVDNISEDLLDVAMAKGDRTMTNRKNEIISITKLDQVYRVDLKFTYTNTYNIEMIKYPQIFIGFNDQGLINYIDNSYK